MVCVRVGHVQYLLVFMLHHLLWQASFQPLVCFSCEASES